MHQIQSLENYNYLFANHYFYLCKFDKVFKTIKYSLLFITNLCSNINVRVEK